MPARDRKEAAKDREEGKKAAVSAKAAKDAEDARWAGAENEKTKGAVKKEEAEKKKLEAAAKKTELKRLEEEEAAQASTSKAKTKAPVAGAVKVTAHQLETQREKEERLRQEELRERQLASKREVSEESYSKLVEGENTNRATDVVEARTLTEAISVLAVEDSSTDKHPEKRARAAWLAYEARELPVVKADKPGLKMSQYRDMLWKAWQKSPENPIVQARAAMATP